MKKLLLFLFLSTCIPLDAVSSGPEQRIIVDVPTYNNKDWWQLNLESILKQNYRNYLVYITDDNSTDGTAQAIEQYIKKNNLEKKVILIKNKIRRRSLANHYTIIHKCQPTDIIIHVDGDDFLNDEDVFSYINEIYHKDPSLLCTYGSYVNWPTEELGYCAPPEASYIKERRYREGYFIFGHLRTYRAGLLQRIKLEDLLCNQDPCPGKFYEASADLALAYPSLEMAHGKFAFIDKILYMRNIKTPLNNFKVNRAQQAKCAKIIHALKRYSPLKTSALTSPWLKEPHTDIIVIADRHTSLQPLLNTLPQPISSTQYFILYPESLQEQNILKNRYTNIQWYPYTPKLFKKTLIRAAKASKADYLLFINPHAPLPFALDLKKYAHVMQRTAAYAFYLDYTAPHTTDWRAGEWLENNIYALPLIVKNEQWVTPHNFSNTLYERKSIIKVIKSKAANTLSELEKEMYHTPIEAYKVGLFLKFSHDV